MLIPEKGRPELSPGGRPLSDCSAVASELGLAELEFLEQLETVVVEAFRN